MREESIKPMLEKYKKGLTSSEEEQLLFDHIDEQDIEMYKLSTFVKNKKVTTPRKLNEKLWDSFEEKIKDKQKPKRIWQWSAVASILLILAWYVPYDYQNHLEEMEKQRLLEEAKSMFLKKTEPTKNDKILFEDETLIVFVRTER